jgi:hemolysin III
MSSKYSPLEEKWNVYTHLSGIILSVFATILMLYKTIPTHHIYKTVSAIIFGLSLIILYTASTLYHNATNPSKRRLLNIFDHAAIFVLIAGTYTPFALVSLHGKTGWWLFGIIWTVALAGIILKLFFTGKYQKSSTILYILMGWIVVFFIKPLLQVLPKEGFYWLAAGGLFYTIGAIFFSINKIKMNHAIFHVWVLLGSLAQFIAVYFYVL